MTTNDQCTLQSALETLSVALQNAIDSQKALDLQTAHSELFDTHTAQQWQNAINRVEFQQYIAINCPSAL